MKYLLLLGVGITVFCSCSEVPQLKNETALQLIITEFRYPRLIEYDIYCSDPQHAKNLLDAGLDKNGLVIIQKTQKLKDIGSPLISFTEKAQPYLLTGSAKDKSLDIQKVKIADEEVSEVIIRKSGDDPGKLLAVYTTVCKNITTFSLLLKRNLKEPVKHKAYFSLSDGRWVLQKPLR